MNVTAKRAKTSKNCSHINNRRVSESRWFFFWKIKTRKTILCFWFIRHCQFPLNVLSSGDYPYIALGTEVLTAFWFFRLVVTFYFAAQVDKQTFWFTLYNYWTLQLRNRNWIPRSCTMILRASWLFTRNGQWRFQASSTAHIWIIHSCTVAFQWLSSSSSSTHAFKSNCSRLIAQSNFLVWILLLITMTHHVWISKFSLIAYET